MLTIKPTILVVDDEPNISRMAKLIITPLDYRVYTAENGLEAYDKVLEIQPDIIFSDILMPKCDGFEFCYKIKSNSLTKDIPFIFLTAFNDNQLKRMSSGDKKADDCLAKPFSSEDMIMKIDYWLNLRDSENKNGVVGDAEQMATHLDTFKFGVSALDHLIENIRSQSFIFCKGKIGSGKSTLARQFILDGVKNHQKSLLVSFEPIHKGNDPIYNLKQDQESLVDIYDASGWSAVDSLPWKNLDFIYDFLSDLCNKTNYHRIVLDSFSHGHLFWDNKDVVMFVSLCRELVNHENQCIMWTFNSHPSLNLFEYNLESMMDVGVSLQHNQAVFTAAINFTKWQPCSNEVVDITGRH